jgi:hypothetical protein
MTSSLGNGQDEGRKNDDVHCKHEQSGMPDYRSKPQRPATRCSTMVMSQASIIMIEPAKGHGCLSAGFTRRGESVVELTQLRDRFSAVSERDVIERGVELRGRPKVRSHLAKADDLGADGKRCKQLCALQWRCLG